MRMTQIGYHYLLHHLKYETLCKGYKAQNTNAQEGRETKAGTNPQRDLDMGFRVKSTGSAGISQTGTWKETLES